MTLYPSIMACDGCGRLAGYAGESYCLACERDGTAARHSAEHDARIVSQRNRMIADGTWATRFHRRAA